MPSTTPIVFVVDDDVSVRESLEGLIQSEGWNPVVLSSAEAFLAHSRPAIPNCLILDVGLPKLNGLDLQQLIVGDRIETPIIFITGCGDVPMTVRAMKAGAIEFLIKPFDDEVLIRAVCGALERSQTALNQESSMRALRDDYATLTRREREVMRLVVSGRLNKQIGGDLDISEITVKAHRGKAMRKMKARSLAELVTMAGKLQLVSAPALTSVQQF
jgi:FixJ family two-component response regulator